MTAPLAIYQYSSDDDLEKEIVAGVQPSPKKLRGPGVSWVMVASYENIQSARESINPDLKKTGRSYRGVTPVYYYYCCFKSCGCKKQYRLVTSKTTSLVIEEETVGVHTMHEELQRNGGRGLSFEQVSMVKQAGCLNIKKPKEIVRFIVAKAGELLLEGAIA